MPFNRRGRKHNEEGHEAQGILGAYTLCVQRELRLAPRPLTLFAC